MPIIKEYEHCDAIDLSELIKKKEITPNELLETAIERIEKINPKINAVTTKMYEEAYSTILRLDGQGVFEGVPFLLKDLGTLYKGVPTTHGSRYFQDFIPDHDSEIVHRFKKEGLVIFGKTNTPEFGLSYLTESEFLGTCHNPWHLDYTPGGSSGGAAAAVAARIVPMAHASDGGGSIRVPASCCGLFGLKPTRARIPCGPDVGEGWSGLATSHVITITVRDCAAMLDALTGSEIGDPYYPPPQKRRYIEEINIEPKPLKIAMSRKAMNDIPIDKECLLAVEKTAALCESLGHHIIEATPDYDAHRMTESMRIIVAANALMNLRFRAKTLGKSWTPDDIEEINWKIAEEGERFVAADYAKALFIMHNQSRKIAPFFEEYDLLLTPTCARPPIKIGSVNLNVDDVMEFFQDLYHFAPFTALWNQTGQPAMSVPLYWSSEGLPIGTQFVARFGDEATLLRLAAQLEVAEPWRNQFPTLI